MSKVSGANLVKQEPQRHGHNRGEQFHSITKARGVHSKCMFFFAWQVFIGKTNKGMPPTEECVLLAQHNPSTRVVKVVTLRSCRSVIVIDS